MYFRNSGYIDVHRFTQAVRAIPETPPLSLSNRLLLSAGMILMPVAAFFLILAIGRVASVL